MAMKIPSITSKLANNALNAKHGEEILEGNSAEEFANQIISILENKELADKLSKNGYTFVHKNYNWDAATQKLEKLMTNSKLMETLFLYAIFVSLAGFLVGLVGKAWAVNKKSVKKSEFFNRFTILFLILMFILLIFYQFII